MGLLMNLFKAVFFIILFAACGSIQAHTSLVSSLPENNQVIIQVPQQLELHFGDPVNLMRVELRGESVRQDLDISANLSASDQAFAAFPPNLPEGRYTMRWTALSQDGHSITGALSFTLASP